MIFIFFLFLCFYLPFQIALNPAPGIDLASIRVLIILLFLIWLLNQFWNKKKLIQSNLQVKLILFFLLISAISLFFAQNYSWAARKILFLFSIFPIYFVAGNILDKKEKIIKTIKMLVFSGALVSVVGILQFFSQYFWNQGKISEIYSNFIGPLFWGKSFSQLVLQYPSWLVGVSGQTYFRAIATFPDPHIFVMFLEMLLPLSIVLIFVSQAKKIWLISFFFIFFSAILTFSRGGYLGIAAGIIIFIFAFWKRIEVQHRLIAGIMATFFILMLTVPGPISGRFVSSFDLKEGSNAGRIEMWEKALEIIKKKPLTGTGIGNFSLAIDNTVKYRNPIYAHNTYLDIAAEEGLLASLIWILILFITLKDFWNFSKQDLIFAGFFVSVVIFSVHSLVETGLYSPAVLTLFLIIISFRFQQYEK